MSVAPNCPMELASRALHVPLLDFMALAVSRSRGLADPMRRYMGKSEWDGSLQSEGTALCTMARAPAGMADNRASIWCLGISPIFRTYLGPAPSPM
jgi:hypothetical protein